MQAAGAHLFNAGALAWELSRLCSMLAPALAGSAQLPLATGRSAFINAAGTAPVMPLPAQMRAQAGLLGNPLMGAQCMHHVPLIQRACGRPILCQQASSQLLLLAQLAGVDVGRSCSRRRGRRPCLQHAPALQ